MYRIVLQNQAERGLVWGKGFSVPVEHPYPKIYRVLPRGSVRKLKILRVVLVTNSRTTPPLGLMSGTSFDRSRNGCFSQIKCFSNSMHQLSCLIVNFTSTIRFVLFIQSAFSRRTEKRKGHGNKKHALHNSVLSPRLKVR